MVSAISSMLASSSAATNSVLNTWVSSWSWTRSSRCCNSASRSAPLLSDPPYFVFDLLHHHGRWLLSTRRVLRCSFAGPGTKDQTLRQRVGPKPVRAVDGHACGLASREEPFDGRRSIDVGVYAAHHVVHHRTDGDQVLDGVDALVLQTQLTHHGKLDIDQLRAQVAQVEMNDRPVRRLDRAPLLDFLYEGLRQPVPRSELHAAKHWRGLRRAQVVVL